MDLASRRKPLEEDLSQIQDQSVDDLLNQAPLSRSQIEDEQNLTTEPSNSISRTSMYEPNETINRSLRNQPTSEYEDIRGNLAEEPNETINRSLKNQPASNVSRRPSSEYETVDGNLITEPTMKNRYYSTESFSQPSVYEEPAERALPAGMEFTEYSSDSEEESLSEKKKSEFSNPLYISLLIFILIGIVINLFLLYRIDIFDVDGNLIPEERRSYASMLGIGLAIVLGIIFFGGLYLIFFSSKIKSSAVGIVIALVVAFIITFLMGWLVGIYVGINHLWMPDQNLVSYSI